MLGHRLAAISVAMGFLLMSMVGVSWDTEAGGAESRFNFTAETAVTYDMLEGWYLNNSINYFDFGETLNNTTRVWLFLDNATDTRVAGQNPVFEHVDAGVFSEITTGSAGGNTHFRRVCYVWVALHQAPANYTTATGGRSPRLLLAGSAERGSVFQGSEDPRDRIGFARRQSLREDLWIKGRNRVDHLLTDDQQQHRLTVRNQAIYRGSPALMRDFQRPVFINNDEARVAGCPWAERFDADL